MAAKAKAKPGKTPRRPAVGIILAAGQSTRMNTDMPKVLHEVCGRPMLEYVIDACRGAGIERLFVVVGYGKDTVIERFNGDKGITWVHQAEQKGTGHAVLCCRKHLEDFDGDCVVVCGDGPLLRPQTLNELLDKHNQEHSVATLATAVLDDPSGYGRIARDSYGNLQGIVEHADCTPEQLRIREINPSYYCFDCRTLLDALDRITPNNVKNEYYLTDALQIVIQSGKRAIAITAVNAEDVLSINSRRQLAVVSKLMQDRIQAELMNRGVTIVDPANTWIDARAEIGKDSVIHPFTYIHGKVRVGRNCHVGPFAFVREGTVLDDDVVFGVFAEIKNSRLGQGTRARHHTYIGDAQIGRQVNVGAGTIFANYDGREVHPTEIGDHTFIGSGAVLVAPVRVKPRSSIQPGTVVRNNATNSLGEQPPEPAKKSKRGISKT
ncbi:MAG: NTP transferase domain-containing protein [Phycisphaerae bacterium]|nr:NTP transferase domain-containing protein [Phycisphaerae bacterium]